MNSLVTARCPFRNVPISKKSRFGEGITVEDMTKLRWLKPKLVGKSDSPSGHPMACCVMPPSSRCAMTKILPKLRARFP
jgi:hypothetical protein